MPTSIKLISERKEGKSSALGEKAWYTIIIQIIN